MEVERWYVHPVRPEVGEVEEAVAALLDIVGAPMEKIFAPRNELDLYRLGVACRRQGTELVMRCDDIADQGEAIPSGVPVEWIPGM